MESLRGRVLIERYSAGWYSAFVCLRFPPPLTENCATGVINVSIFPQEMKWTPQSLDWHRVK